MTGGAISAFTGQRGKVTVDGSLVALSDFKVSIKGDTITQPRMGESGPRKVTGMKDLTFSLTNLDLDGRMMALAFADAIPTTARTVIDTCDTSGNWASSAGSSVIQSPETSLKYEGTACLKVVSATDPSGNTITRSSLTSNISGAHVLEMWIRSTVAGAIGTIGFGESAITEQTQAVVIQKANQWERQVMFLSDISGTSRDLVTKVGFTFANTASLMTGSTIYIDNINALTGFRFGAGVKFTLTGQAVSATDPTQYFDIMMPNAFLTSADIEFGDASKIINGPMSGAVEDISDVVIAYSQ